MDSNPKLSEIVRQIFRHPFRQSRHQNSLLLGRRSPNPFNQVIDLVLCRQNRYLGFDQARGANDLLDTLLLVCIFIRTRRSRHINNLVDPVLELLKRQRTVVDRRRQPETVLDEIRLASVIAVVHPTNLRQRHVRLVDEHQEVFREVVQQRPRCGTCWAPT